MMKKSTITIFIASLVLSIAFGDIPCVSAQESQDEEFTLEEIIVTAEKREVNIQDTAFSITAVMGADLRDEALNTLAAAMKNIPSVEVAASIAGGQIYIRGIGAFGGGEPSTAVMLDEVYSGSSMAVTSSLYDVERVEVLRGPQGTLYGRNATGGIVNVVSRKPIIDKFEVLANLQMGNFNLKHFDGALNIPLSDKWAGRVAFLHETRDGYLSNGGNASDRNAAKVKLLFQPNNNFSIVANVDYFNNHALGAANVPVPGSAGNLPNLAPFRPWRKPDVDGDGVADDFYDPDAAGGPPIPGFPSAGRTPNGIPDIIDTGWLVPDGADPWTIDEWHVPALDDLTQTIYSLKMDWDLNWGLLTILPSYSELNNKAIGGGGDLMVGTAMTQTGVISSSFMPGGPETQYTGEARLTSPTESAFEYVVGFYASKKETAMFAMEMQDFTTGWHWTNSTSPSKTIAFFGEATYPVIERFRVTGGLRHSTDKESLDYRYWNDNSPVGNPVQPEGGPYDSGWVPYKKDITSTTYTAGIEFDVAEGSMLYVYFRTGFNQGGLNGTVPPSEYDPEELDAWEFGSKNRFLGGKMQLNLEGYYYQYTNMQGQASDMMSFAGISAPTQKIFNAETGTNKGVDIEFDYLITQNDRVNLGVALIDATYGKLLLPPNVDFGTAEPFQLEGRQVAMSPDWAFSLGYQHTWRLDNGDRVTGGFDTKVSAGYPTTAEQYLAGAWQEDYHRSNFNVTYETANGKWTAGVWAKNLEKDAQTIWVMPFYRRFVTDPRTFGFNVSFRY